MSNTRRSRSRFSLLPQKSRTAREDRVSRLNRWLRHSFHLFAPPTDVGAPLSLSIDTRMLSAPNANSPSRPPYEQYASAHNHGDSHGRSAASIAGANDAVSRQSLQSPLPAHGSESAPSGKSLSQVLFGRAVQGELSNEVMHGSDGSRNLCSQKTPGGLNLEISSVQSTVQPTEQSVHQAYTRRELLKPPVCLSKPDATEETLSSPLLAKSSALAGHAVQAAPERSNILVPCQITVPHTAGFTLTYAFRRQIGEGYYGAVYEAQVLGDRPPFLPEIVAIKVVFKSLMRGNDRIFDLILAEVRAMQHFHRTREEYPSLCGAYGVWQSEEAIFVAMKLYAGDLQALTATLSLGQTQNREIFRFVAAELLISVGALHRNGFIHGDVKPSNILVSFDGHLALADYNTISGFNDPDHVEIPLAGTIPYNAPERLRVSMYHELAELEPLTTKIDIWAIGATLLQFYHKMSRPFFAPRRAGERLAPDIDIEDMKEKTMAHLWSWCFERDTHVSFENEVIRDFLSKLLKKDPRERMTLDEAMGHPLFVTGDEPADWDSYRKQIIHSPLVSPGSSIPSLYRSQEGWERVNTLEFLDANRWAWFGPGIQEQDRDRYVSSMS